MNHLAKMVHEKIKTIPTIMKPIIGLCWLLLATAVSAEPTLPLRPASWIGDQMVLPAGRTVLIRGVAAPETKVTVKFASQVKHAVSDEEGAWQLMLDSMQSTDQGQVLTISSQQTSRQFKDVLVGDIWLCSGQSNMAMAIQRTNEHQAAKEAVAKVDLRYFDGRSWKKVTPKNVSKLSAVGVWFGIEMARRQDKPIGIFVASRGGTSIEAWIPSSGFPDIEEARRMKPLVDDPEVLKASAADARDFRPYGQHRLAKWGLGRAVPASLFEKYLRPFSDLPVCGVVWYQGESNALDGVAKAKQYALWLQSLITSWRQFFGKADLPFLVIELPEYDGGTEIKRAGWAELQKVQATVTNELDGVLLVETKGLGNLKDIHPRRKMEVGRRAAEAACRP